MKGDIHNYKRKLELSLRRLENSTIVSTENKKTVLDFNKECFLEGLSISRVERYVFILRQMGEFLKKDFRDVNKDDVIAISQELDRRGYTDWTKHFYRVALKKFYRWLRKSKEYPEEVAWLKSTVKNGNHKLPEELLTQDDVKKLIAATKYVRNKALIAMLYETGCRVGEIATIQVKNVSFDKYGAVLVVDGKTGMRRVRIINSVPYLSLWLAEHPFRDDPEAPLWPMLNRKNNEGMIEYRAITMFLKKAAIKAGVKKRVNPHAFRHARATYLAKFLTEQQLKKYLGWVPGSDMASVYVHLSGKDVDDALLKLNGIKSDSEAEDKKESESLKPIICVRCECENPATGKFCSKCGMALDMKTVMETEEARSSADETMNQLFKDPKILAVLQKQLTRIKAGVKHE